MVLISLLLLTSDIITSGSFAASRNSQPWPGVVGTPRLQR